MALRNYTLKKSTSLWKNKLLISMIFIMEKIIKRAETNPTHNIICANILAALVNAIALKHTEYFMLTSDSKIYIPKLNHFI